MKWLLFLLSSLSVAASDFRLVGTNLFDFSSMTSDPAFHVSGRVIWVYPQSIEVAIQVGNSHKHMGVSDFVEFPGPPEPPPPVGDVILVEKWNDAAQIFDGFDYCLNPDFRDIYLLHSATELAGSYSVGSWIECTVVPTSHRDFYDCGIPFVGDTNSFSRIYFISHGHIFVRTNSISVRN